MWALQCDTHAFGVLLEGLKRPEAHRLGVEYRSVELGGIATPKPRHVVRGDAECECMAFGEHVVRVEFEEDFLGDLL